MKRCAGCGLVVRLHWPHPDSPHGRRTGAMFCTKECAATFAYAIAQSGGGHCQACGDLGCQRDHEE